MRGQAELESCHCSLPSLAGTHAAPSRAPRSRDWGSWEHGEHPAAALGNTGVVMAILSRAALSP